MILKANSPLETRRNIRNREKRYKNALFSSKNRKHKTKSNAKKEKPKRGTIAIY